MLLFLTLPVHIISLNKLEISGQFRAIYIYFSAFSCTRFINFTTVKLNTVCPRKSCPNLYRHMVMSILWKLDKTFWTFLVIYRYLLAAYLTISNSQYVCIVYTTHIKKTNHASITEFNFISKSNISTGAENMKGWKKKFSSIFDKSFRYSIFDGKSYFSSLKSLRKVA